MTTIFFDNIARPDFATTVLAPAPAPAPTPTPPESTIHAIHLAPPALPPHPPAANFAMDRAIVRQHNDDARAAHSVVRRIHTESGGGGRSAHDDANDDANARRRRRRRPSRAAATIDGHPYLTLRRSSRPLKFRRHQRHRHRSTSTSIDIDIVIIVPPSPSWHSRRCDPVVVRRRPRQGRCGRAEDDGIGTTNATSSIISSSFLLVLFVVVFLKYFWE